MGQIRAKAANGIYRPQEHISATEAAEKIGCSRMQVNRLIHLKLLTGCRLTPDGWWKVSRVSLDSYLSALSHQESNHSRPQAPVKKATGKKVRR